MAFFDPDELQKEMEWLLAHPDFEERPATLAEFLGAKYLNIEGMLRPAILRELREIFGDEVSGRRIAKYNEALITGGIGIGKTTIASVVLPYLVHWTLCLKNPQQFFKFLPGTRIAFMMMSTSEGQGKEVVFGDVKARIEYSPWFQEKYPYDRSFKNQLRFAKDIWIIPGTSSEKSFEGYNILGGIIDEADSFEVTDLKDYAEEGYTTISSRISSRFGDRGFLLVIGQKKKSNGFIARKVEEFGRKPNAYTVSFAIWESFGWQDPRYLNDDGTHNSFYFDTKRYEVVTKEQADFMGAEGDTDIIEVPMLYFPDFDNDPQKALRDLAGIPPISGSPFIVLRHKIEACPQRWVERINAGVEDESHWLRSPFDSDGILQPWFRATERLKRAIHIDIAYSADGDGLGFAMGHVPEMVEREGELKPFIMIDCVLRMHAAPGREIQISDIRRVVYELIGDRKFRIQRATMDGFQSTDTKQQFIKRRIDAEIVSMDRQLMPYEDLREAIYEERIAWPQYMVKVRPTDTKLTEIVVKEVTELVDDGKKVDHPPGGSKDVADSIAGVTFSLMGDRTYHHKVIKMPPSAGGFQPQSNFPGGGVAVVGPQAPIPHVGSPATSWSPSVTIWQPPVGR